MRSIGLKFPSSVLFLLCRCSANNIGANIGHLCFSVAVQEFVGVGPNNCGSARSASPDLLQVHGERS